MGAVISSYSSKRRNRKLRRQMVKKIFCVQKVKKEVLPAEIPVVSWLAAAAKSNVNREAIYNESVRWRDENSQGLFDGDYERAG